jgi:hypothetical protein
VSFSDLPLTDRVGIISAMLTGFNIGLSWYLASKSIRVANAAAAKSVTIANAAAERAAADAKEADQRALLRIRLAMQREAYQMAVTMRTNSRAAHTLLSQEDVDIVSMHLRHAFGGDLGHAVVRALIDYSAAHTRDDFEPQVEAAVACGRQERLLLDAIVETLEATGLKPLPGRS